MTPRLHASQCAPGMRVVCPEWKTLTITDVDGGLVAFEEVCGRYYPSRFILAPDDRPCTCHPSEAPTPCAKRYALSECQAAAPALPAMTEELLAACVETHAHWRGPGKDHGPLVGRLTRLLDAIERAPGIIPLPAPQLTDTREDAWWFA